MREFIISSRETPFNAIIILFKHTLFKNFLSYFLCSILMTLITIPMLLLVLNINIADLPQFQAEILEMQKKMLAGENPQSLSLFENVNNSLLFLLIPIIYLIFSFMMNLLLSNNDQFIKLNEINLKKSFKMSFSVMTLKIFFSIILFGIYFMCMVLALGLIIKLMGMISGILAGFVGFLLFILVVLIILKTVYIIPAMIHGNLSLVEAFKKSLKAISFKRSGGLIIIGIGMFLLFIIAAMLLQSILSAIFDGPTFMIVNQIFSTFLMAVLMNLIIAGLSTLYYRYSQDAIEFDEKDHIIEESQF